MGTKAIFKIFNEGKFVIGSWVRFDGGVGQNDIFPYFINKLKYDVDKKSIYDTINQFVLDGKFNNLSTWDKKNPFRSQMNEDWQTSVSVLFWEKSISEKKLLEQSIYADYTYEFRFNKDGVKIKVIYTIYEKTFELKGYWNTTSIIKMVQDLNKWVDDIEYGLNDCDCKDEK